MFSSLASFLFGSNTSATTNSEINQNLSNQQVQENQVNCNPNTSKDFGSEEAENTIEVTSSTPSVTGADSLTASSIYQPKKGTKKRNRNSNKNKRQGNTNGNAGAGQKKPTSSITKLLTPNDSLDEDFDDDDDWYIVEKEEEGEEASLPRTDSEEEVSVVGIKPRLVASGGVGAQQNRHRHFHINSHSLYSGPRPQQQRNFLQRVRNSGARLGGPLTSSTLNPSSAAIITPPNGLADGGMTQSLYVACNQHQQQHFLSNNDTLNGANVPMEESWYVTPPPCFTSVGPINLETSPYENLLIEHPSMSVYHSIRSAQEATESFVNLDLGVNESQQIRTTNTSAIVPSTPRNQQSVQPRSSGEVRTDRQSVAQLKQELMARCSQKSREKKERQKLCATAMKRSNAAREYQSKGNRPRRSDLQHYKVNSGANNNRNTSRKSFF